MGQEHFIIHFMAIIFQLIPLSFHMCHPVFWFHSDVFHLELNEFSKIVNLSSLDLGSHLFSSFFQARCKSSFGKASVLALSAIVNDVSLVARIKFLYPLFVSCLYLSICFTTRHVCVSRYIRGTF